jgi:hypothetical protein
MCEALGSSPSTAVKKGFMHSGLTGKIRATLFLFGDAGVWIWGFALSKQVLTTWATPPTPGLPADTRIYGYLGF